MDNSKKVWEMMIQAREISGVSRQQVADRMNVSYKTVWNWENRKYEISAGQLFDYFEAIGIDIKSSINSHFNNDNIVGYDLSEKQIKDELCTEIRSYTIRMASMLHFILKGKHGANIEALLNSILTHLMTNLSGRCMNVVLQLTNYRLHKSDKDFGIKPNTRLVHEASIKASKSIIEGKNGYVISEEYNEDKSEATDGMLDI